MSQVILPHLRSLKKINFEQWFQNFFKVMISSFFQPQSKESTQQPTGPQGLEISELKNGLHLHSSSSF